MINCVNVYGYVEGQDLSYEGSVGSIAPGEYNHIGHFIRGAQIVGETPEFRRPRTIPELAEWTRDCIDFCVNGFGLKIGDPLHFASGFEADGKEREGAVTRIFHARHDDDVRVVPFMRINLDRDQLKELEESYERLRNV